MDMIQQIWDQNKYFDNFLQSLSAIWSSDGKYLYIFNLILTPLQKIDL